MVPYLLYQFIYLLFQIVLKHKTIDLIVILRMLMGILMGDGYDTPYSIPVCLPCWFLVSIIQLRILFLMIPINKISSSFLTVGSIIGLLILKVRNIDLYFCLDSTMMAIPYFIFGHYLAKWLKGTYPSKTLLIVVGISALWVYFTLQINGSAQMIAPSFGNNVLLNYSAGIAGTLLIMALSMLIAKKLGDNVTNRTISRNTLFLIFFHWVLLIPFRMIIWKILAVISDRTGYTFLMAALVSFCILVVSKYIITYGVKRFPMLYGKSK